MSKILGGLLKQDHHFTQPTLKEHLVNHLDAQRLSKVD